MVLTAVAATEKDNIDRNGVEGRKGSLDGLGPATEAWQHTCVGRELCD